MGRYFVLWEIDNSLVPIDLAERNTGFKLLIDMVKKDMEKGKIREWGIMVGELRGGAIAEGSAEEIHEMMHQYIPICQFELHELVSVDQVEAILNATAE